MSEPYVSNGFSASVGETPQLSVNDILDAKTTEAINLVINVRRLIPEDTEYDGFRWHIVEAMRMCLDGLRLIRRDQGVVPKL